MKSLQEQMTANKKIYEFKIKVVGEQEDCAVGKLKDAFARFDITECSAGMRSPIQETQLDFPDHKNNNATIFDISLNYPATSYQVRDLVAEALNLTHSEIVIRSTREQMEYETNHEHDDLSNYTTLLGTPYAKSNNQDCVGENRTMALLKELNKTRHAGDVYKGVNQHLLAKKIPAEKKTTSKVPKNVKFASPVGSTQNKISNPYPGN